MGHLSAHCGQVLLCRRARRWHLTHGNDLQSHMSLYTFEHALSPVKHTAAPAARFYNNFLTVQGRVASHPA